MGLKDLGKDILGAYGKNDTHKAIALHKDIKEHEIKQTLYHELQHAIQDIENFAKGGTNKSLDTKDYARLLGEVEARNVEKRMIDKHASKVSYDIFKQHPNVFNADKYQQALAKKYNLDYERFKNIDINNLSDNDKAFYIQYLQDSKNKKLDDKELRELYNDYLKEPIPHPHETMDTDIKDTILKHDSGVMESRELEKSFLDERTANIAEIDKKIESIMQEISNIKIDDYNVERAREVLKPIVDYAEQQKQAFYKTKGIKLKAFIEQYEKENPPPKIDFSRLEPDLLRDVAMTIRNIGNNDLKRYIETIRKDSIIQQFYEGINKLEKEKDDLLREIRKLEDLKSKEFNRLMELERKEKLDTGYRSKIDSDSDVMDNIIALMEYDYTKDEINRLKRLSDDGNETAEAILRNYDTPHYGRGYDGYSMSNNAADAYEHGIKPLSKWVAQDAKDFSEVVGAKFTLKELKEFLQKYGEKGKHHTSSYYNSTQFYSLAEAFATGKSVLKEKGAKILDEFAEILKETKNKYRYRF